MYMHRFVFRFLIGPPLAVCATAAWIGAAPQAMAIPQFARAWGLSCTDCHVLPPKLNARGEEFLERGYRWSDDRNERPDWRWPLAVWVTGRYENQVTREFDQTFAPKVELISGGPIGSWPLSYFLEWRAVSLETRSNGTLRDRSGRFEDAYLDWNFAQRHSVKIGQFRSLNQYDVSLRLSVTEPAAFSSSIAGDFHPDSRIRSLRGFSPAGRSPGLTYSYQSIAGERPHDGLFHFFNIPFVGELSAPLNEEARREASFELRGPPKGVFLETFYRRGLNSLGAHAFWDEDRWLAMAVGRLHWRDFYATGAVGADDAEGRPTRGRYSLELEYLPTRWEWVRPGIGFRVEHISHTRTDPAYNPYFALYFPNSKFTLLLQVQYRLQQNNEAFFCDLSLLF